MRDFAGAIGLDDRIGCRPTGSLAGVWRVAHASQEVGVWYYDQYLERRGFDVFMQICFARNSVSVLSHVGQCEVTDPFRISHRLLAQQISARAVGRKGVG